MECGKNELLKQLQCNNFAAYDMLLYLDTHPNDKKAFDIFKSLVEKTKALKLEFENSFGPLSAFDSASQGCFNWLCSPWPWEKEGNE